MPSPLLQAGSVRCTEADRRDKANDRRVVNDQRRPSSRT
jgi:hypothetical protein